MKTKFILLYCLSILLLSFQVPDVKIAVYIDNYKMEVTEEQFVNCRKINDLSIIMPITEEMKRYDIFKVELHRFGPDEDIIVAFKIFDPSSKEFKKKIAPKESVKLMVLEKEGQFTGSDLETNTTIFSATSRTNQVFCDSHDLKKCSFYFIVRGYNKTGEKTQFNEDVFDKGVSLSSKSVVFKSWIDRTVK